MIYIPYIYIKNFLQINPTALPIHDLTPTCNQMLCRASTAVMRRGKSTVTILSQLGRSCGEYTSGTHKKYPKTQSAQL